MISTKTTTKTRSSASEASILTIQEFDRAVEVQRDDFDRGAKAWRRYFPINYGKWDPAALKVLQEEYRHPVQFDIASPKVDTLAGSLVADLPDPTWVPVQGEKSIASEAIAEMYYTERDLYNYDDAFLKVFRDGLVHCGDLAIVEDYKYHTPHIKLSRIIHGFLVWDPYWLTDDDRDAEVCYHIAYMTADKLARKYSHRTDEILREAREYRKDKTNYPMDPSEVQKNRSMGRVGDEFQVIEKHYVEHIKTTRLMGRQEGKQQWIPFPIQKEQAYLMRFAEMNNIDWTTVIEDTYEDRISYVTTVCRELQNAEIQHQAKNKVQVNGLPFHHFTTRRHNGKNLGFMESLEGIEDTINKRESLVTEGISKANGGSILVNDALFPDPRKREAWAKNKNKPGHAEFAPLDDVQNIMQHLVPTTQSGAISEQISRMYNEVLPLVSRVSDALSSASSSTDSGILFERKFQVNMIANTLMNREMRQFLNNVSESYFYQWQITHSDREQPVRFRDGRNVVLNQRVQGAIYNDVTSVPRCRVVTAENTKSQTYQMRWRSIWSEMLASIDPNVAPAHYMLALKNFFETVQTKEEDKASMKVMNEMVMMISRLNLVSQATGYQAKIQGDTMQSAQIDMQMQSLMQQLQATQAPAVPPQGHMAPEGQTPVVYPDQNVSGEPPLADTINPPSIEDVSGGMPTPTPMSEVS